MDHSKWSTNAGQQHLDASLASILDINPFTLAFKSPAVEGDFLGEVANRRWPVLVFIFFFDICCFLFRMFAKLTSCGSESGVRPLEVVQEMGHQLANMALLYVLIGLLNKRARKAGDNAARQEEVLLSICMGLAICNLLASLRQDNAMDYVYVSFFLICTSTFLKIRWWVGTGLLAAPTVAVMVWTSSPAWSALLPPDALVHIVVAWAVGGLMAYLSDWYRRQMYANARLACAAHEKEMMEATARIQAQRELAAAQAQAAQRALTVAREKAAHEAKSEFMSLMCHEVRTPLNGCLASAEMLLETPLKEEQRELANTIRVSGSILLSTVSNFLDFFKLEAGKRLDIVRSEVELADLVGDVQRIIEAMITRGGDVRLQPPQLIGVPQAVFCDPDRLRGILLNLYTNAAKFTKAGHIVLRVSCVPRGETPAAPPGYSSIMLQPSYHPSGSRTPTDMGPAVILNPPAALVQSAGTSKAAPRSSAQAAAEPAAGADAAADWQQSPGPDDDADDDAQQEPAGQEPFWHQASRWAHSLLPSQLEDSSSSLLQEDAEQQLAAEQAATTAKKEGQSAGSSSSSLRGAQFEVHATTSAEAAAADDAASHSHSAAIAARHHQQQQQQAAAAGPAAGVALSSISSDGGRQSLGRQSLGLSEDMCWLLFEVEDTGVGITTDGLATLFKEYVQGTDDEMTKPRTRGGTGLGLSICSKQVGVLGGVIGAHSCRGHGSTFWFKIPTYVRPGSRAQGASPAAAAAKQQQQQPTPDSSSQAAAEAAQAAGGAEPALQPEQRQQSLRPPPVPQQQLPVSNVVVSSFYQPSTAAASGSAGRPPPGSRAGAAGAAAGETATKAAVPDGAATPAAAAAGLEARTGVSPAAAAVAPPASNSGATAAAGGGHAAAVPHSRQLSLDGPRPGPALDASRLAGRRVLLAEDNLINQTVARKMLSSLGMQVQVAANGQEALTAVQRTAQAAGGQGDGAFAIVLMDMAMPVMGGVEATRAIRAGGFTLPIVAMTANASDKDRDECAAAGMNGFLSKPVLRDQLARAMLAAVEEYEGPAVPPAAKSTATPAP